MNTPDLQVPADARYGGFEPSGHKTKEKNPFLKAFIHSQSRRPRLLRHSLQSHKCHQQSNNLSLLNCSDLATIDA